MRWSGANLRYQCDLGYGETMFEVRRAEQNWSQQALVTTVMINQARQQPGAAQPPVPANAADVAARRAALRADFSAAEASWKDWTPA